MAARSRKDYSGHETEEHAESMVHEGAETMRRAGQETAEQFGRSVLEQGHRSTSAALKAFDAFNGPLVRALDQNRQIFERMVHAMQEESLKFVNRRLEHTSRAIEGARECQGVSGLLAVHQEFLMDMAFDYANQTRRFAEIMHEMTDEAGRRVPGNGNGIEHEDDRDNRGYRRSTRSSHASAANAA